MSWMIHMGGHTDNEEREREILAAAQAFAAVVRQDGSGSFSGKFTGPVALGGGASALDTGPSGPGTGGGGGTGGGTGG